MSTKLLLGAKPVISVSSRLLGRVGHPKRIMQLDRMMRCTKRYLSSLKPLAQATMRGLQYYGKNDIRFSDKVKEPQIKVDDEAIIEVEYCGICGSDLSEYTKGPLLIQKDGKPNQLSGEKLPLCLGHEMSGRIIKAGPGVTKFKVGDRVVVEATATCSDRHRYPHFNRDTQETCEACKHGHTNACRHLSFCGLGFSDGGLSERVTVSEAHLVKLPDEIPFDIGAMIEPLAVAWHAVRLSGFKEGSSGLVLGSGPIGLATVLALQGHGARQIVVSEPAEIRRKEATEFGATAFDPLKYKTTEEALAALKSLTDSEGFDYSYDASGVQASLDTSIWALRAGGKATNIAIWGDQFKQFKPMSVTLEEKTYGGSMCYLYEDFVQVIDAIVSKKMDINKCRKMITGVVPIEDGVQKGFEELIHNKAHHIKILLTPKKENLR